MFHPWKPSAQGRISPTPTLQLQYSRCSWQCIMKIGRETCYPLPWRAFKSWINFFLPPPLNHCRFFIRSSHLCAYMCVCVSRTRAGAHRCGKMAQRSSASLSLYDFSSTLFLFPFLSTRTRERRKYRGDLFYRRRSPAPSFLLFGSWFNFFFFFSFQPSLKRRVISPGLKGRLKGVIFLMRTAN